MDASQDNTGDTQQLLGDGVHQNLQSPSKKGNPPNISDVIGVLQEDHSYHGWGLDDFIRPLLALLGIAFLPLYALVWMGRKAYEALTADIFLGYSWRPADGHKPDQIFQWFYNIYEDPHQFRRSFAYLMAFLYAAIQAAVVFAAMQGFLLSQFAFGGPSGLLLAATIGTTTGLVNYNLAISFMIGLFTAANKKDPHLADVKKDIKKSWSKSFMYNGWLYGLAGIISLAASAIMAALTWHVLGTMVTGAGALAGLGPMGILVPYVGGIATLVAYFVMFFCEVRDSLNDHWKGQKTLVQKFKDNWRWASEHKAEAALNLLLITLTLVGLAVTVYVGMGDMVADLGVPSGVAWTFAAINFIGAAGFFGKGAAGMGAYFHKLWAGFTATFEDGGWGFRRAVWRSFSETFLAVYRHGHAIYVKGGHDYRRVVNANGQSVMVRQFTQAKHTSIDAGAYVLARSGIVNFARLALFILTVFTIVAIFAGASMGIPTLGVVALLAGRMALKFAIGRWDTQDNKEQAKANTTTKNWTGYESIHTLSDEAENLLREEVYQRSMGSSPLRENYHQVKLIADLLAEQAGLQADIDAGRVVGIVEVTVAGLSTILAGLAVNAAGNTALTLCQNLQAWQFYMLAVGAPLMSISGAAKPNFTEQDRLWVREVDLVSVNEDQEAKYARLFGNGRRAVADILMPVRVAG